MFWCLVNVSFSLLVAVYQYLRKQHVMKVLKYMSDKTRFA